MTRAPQVRNAVLAVAVAATLSGCITPSPRPGDDSAPVIVAGKEETVSRSASGAKADSAPSDVTHKGEPSNQSGQTATAESDPTPARAPAQVMRIWIAPWEDSAGNLHGASHVFTEILPRRWQLASATETATTTVLTPRQLEPRQVSSPEPSRKP